MASSDGESAVFACMWARCLSCRPSGIRSGSSVGAAESSRRARERFLAAAGAEEA